MEQKINIAELLKDAPKGTKLYSPLYGEYVYLYKIHDPSTYVHRNACIEVQVQPNREMVCFYTDGKPLGFPFSECMLFPSKECRTWENFTAEWLHQQFHPLQKVLMAYSNHYQKKEWGLAIYSHWSTIHQCHVLLNGEEAPDYSLIPYKGNEDKLGKLVEGS